MNLFPMLGGTAAEFCGIGISVSGGRVLPNQWFGDGERMRMRNPEREYEYKPKWTVIVLLGGLFSLCAAIFGFMAATNDRGVVINRTIELGTSGATVFWWLLFAASLGFVALAGVMAYNRVTLRQRIVIGPTGLIVPVSRWSAETKKIAYRDIQGLFTVKQNGQHFLLIQHPGGKSQIVAAMLPLKGDFGEVCKLLAWNVSAAQATGRKNA
jgi:hypothetical protein